MVVLRVQIEHVAHAVVGRPVVDRPNTAALAAPFGAPSQLAQATAPWDERALLGPQVQGRLERAVLLVIEVPPQRGREDRRLEEAQGELYAIGALRARVSTARSVGITLSRLQAITADHGLCSAFPQSNPAHRPSTPMGYHPMHQRLAPLAKASAPPR